MIENKEGTERYEFYSTPIEKSNVNREIAYYEPTYSHHKLCIGGSTWTWSRTSVEDGNELFKMLIAKGFQKVEKRSFA